eukprot:6191285-Pleurochrysis_carterae.AAC.3
MPSTESTGVRLLPATMMSIRASGGVEPTLREVSRTANYACIKRVASLSTISLPVFVTLTSDGLSNSGSDIGCRPPYRAKKGDTPVDKCSVQFTANATMGNVSGQFRNCCMCRTSKREMRAIACSAMLLAGAL